MAAIFPFKAVRPSRDKVSLVSARPYGDYAQAELAAQLTYNPLSFLHVLNPAYNDPQRASNEIRFGKVRQKYLAFKEEQILLQDNAPSFYIHQIKTAEHLFKGIIAATSVADYKQERIKRHEGIIDYRINWLKDYLNFAGFNSEPVLMTYQESPAIDQWMEANTQGTPDFEFSTTKNDVHFLWKIDDPAKIQLLQSCFEQAGNLYIADGHHRSASAQRLCDEQNGVGAANYFMSFLIADSNVRIYEFNRLIRNMCGLSKTDFLQRLTQDFKVELKDEKFYQPAEKYTFGLYLDSSFYSLKLKKERRLFATAIDGLDTQILYSRILKPILGIEDLRHDDRIEYLPGNKPISRLISAVDDHQFAMAFTLYPTTVAEIKAVADARLTMPPKSTYIEPKFRSGLVIYEL